MKKSVINFISSKKSKRLTYVLDFILESSLGISYALMEKDEINEANVLTLSYGVNGEFNLFIPASTLLFSDSDDVSLIYKKGEPQILGEEGFDLFATVFYLLVGVEYLKSKDTDEYGRIAEAKLDTEFKTSALNPWVDIYILRLKQELIKLGVSESKFKSRAYKFEIGVDVDQAYLFKGKSLSQKLLKSAGIIKSYGLRGLIACLKPSDDPFDTYSKLEQISDGKAIKYFILIRQNGPSDSRFKTKPGILRKLISTLKKSGNEVFLHSSYLAAENSDLLRNELREFREIGGSDTPIIRQHMLRILYPRTYHIFNEVKVVEDHSAAFYSQPGFRYFTSMPFKWFDPEKNQLTGLTIKPVFFMDRSLVNCTEDISRKECLSKFDLCLEQIKKLDGEARILLHNESLSEVFDWKGFSSTFINLINKLKSTAR